jgi:phage shock protein C
VDKRLYRSRTSHVIGGVCGGLGEYFGIDPTFIRIVAVLLLFADGVSFLGYIIAWIIIPRRSQEAVLAETETTDYAAWNRYIPGAILIFLGLFFLIQRSYCWWHIERIWPVLIIGLGLVLVFRVGSNHNKEKLNEPSQI